MCKRLYNIKRNPFPTFEFAILNNSWPSILTFSVAGAIYYMHVSKLSNILALVLVYIIRFSLTIICCSLFLANAPTGSLFVPTVTQPLFQVTNIPVDSSATDEHTDSLGNTILLYHSTISLFLLR